MMLINVPDLEVLPLLNAVKKIDNFAVTEANEKNILRRKMLMSRYVVYCIFRFIYSLIL